MNKKRWYLSFLVLSRVDWRDVVDYGFRDFLTQDEFFEFEYSRKKNDNNN